MRRILGATSGLLCLLMLIAGLAVATPTSIPQEVSPEDIGEVDAVGIVDGTQSLPAKALQDTIWIADWTFDAPDGSCDDTGWTKIDNRILNDGSNYWYIDTDVQRDERHRQQGGDPLQARPVLGPIIRDTATTGTTRSSASTEVRVRRCRSTS